jgi:ABC-type transport system involved in multi-copper enzyme maturation permease subunit
VSLVASLPPLNPVLARELKQRMRGRHVWLVVTLYLAVLAVILRWVYVAASTNNPFNGGPDLLSSATAGRAIFQWLLFFMLLLVCFIVPGLTAGAISGERERQTLVALQLTLLRPRSIVLGKLLASLAFVVLLIVASLPLVTVPFLVGGVSMPEVVKGLFMVLATAVTLACLTLACSALLRRTQAATVVAYGLTLGMVLGTLLFYGAQQIPRRSNLGQRPAPWVLALNPFAATAEMVQGRTDSGGFVSPFRPLRDLLRLDANGRLGQVFDGSTQFGPIPAPFGGNDQIIVRPAPPPPIGVATTAVGNGGGVAGIVVGPGVAFGSSSGPFQIGQAPVDDTTRLGGIPFLVVALAAWAMLAAVALAATVRRISLPARRESS